jgi:hypothetical protein
MSATIPDQIRRRPVGDVDHLQLSRLVVEAAWRVDLGTADTLYELFVENGTLIMRSSTAGSRSGSGAGTRSRLTPSTASDTYAATCASSRRARTPPRAPPSSVCISTTSTSRARRCRGRSEKTTTSSCVPRTAGGCPPDAGCRCSSARRKSPPTEKRTRSEHGHGHTTLEQDGAGHRRHQQHRPGDRHHARRRRSACCRQRP